MRPADIASGYDALASIWDGPDFDRHNGLDAHRRAIEFVPERKTALDVGCGASGRFIDLFLEHGFVPEGLDLSPGMLTRAQARHPGVTFHLADICEWSPPGTYDLISAWDSIWHVPLAHHGAVLTKLFRHLNPGGVCIFTMGGLDEPQEKVDASMGPNMYYSTLGIRGMLEVVSDAGCDCRHLEFDQYPEPHLVVIAQRP